MPRKVRLKNIIKCQRCLRISPLLEQGGHGSLAPLPVSPTVPIVFSHQNIG